MKINKYLGKIMQKLKWQEIYKKTLVLKLSMQPKKKTGLEPVFFSKPVFFFDKKFFFKVLVRRLYTSLGYHKYDTYTICEVLELLSHFFHGYF